MKPVLCTGVACSGRASSDAEKSYKTVKHTSGLIHTYGIHIYIERNTASEEKYRATYEYTVRIYSVHHNTRIKTHIL